MVSEAKAPSLRVTKSDTDICIGGNGIDKEMFSETVTDSNRPPVATDTDREMVSVTVTRSKKDVANTGIKIEIFSDTVVESDTLTGRGMLSCTSSVTVTDSKSNDPVVILRTMFSETVTESKIDGTNAGITIELFSVTVTDSKIDGTNAGITIELFSVTVTVSETITGRGMLSCTSSVTVTVSETITGRFTCTVRFSVTVTESKAETLNKEELKEMSSVTVVRSKTERYKIGM